jgi:hypothetical protein
VGLEPILSLFPGEGLKIFLTPDYYSYQLIEDMAVGTTYIVGFLPWLPILMVRRL